MTKDPKQATLGGGSSSKTGRRRQASSAQQAFYEIRIRGHLDRHWSEWFDGLTVRHDEDDDTILSGLIVDQSALYGLLERVRDLGLVLVSVNRIEPD